MLPLEIIRMKAKGCSVKLDLNKPGFTLPSNIDELGDDIVELNLSSCSLHGTCGAQPALHWGKRGETGERELGNEERSRIVPVAHSRGVQALFPSRSAI